MGPFLKIGVVYLLLNCKVLAESCPSNEQYCDCTEVQCQDLKCSEKGQLKCPQQSDCHSGCICQSGYLRTAEGNCVPENQCHGDLVCNDNETVNTCPGACIDDFCPTSEDSSLCNDAYKRTGACGDPICVCRFNYRRDNHRGICIPTRDCPPFNCSARPHEEYNPCPPFCPSDSCSQATPTGRCPLPGRIGIVLQCNPKCRCIEGYWRKNGICVPYSECPGICGHNEEYSSCIQAVCRYQNCAQVGRPLPCPIIEEGSCRTGCVCIKGTVRSENGTCILEDRCGPESNVVCQLHAPSCGENEKLVLCTNGCVKDACPKNLDQEVDCVAPAVCGPPTCRCLPNFGRDENGSCIPIAECPGICPEDEEFSDCIQADCVYQNCSQLGTPLACPIIEDGSCRKGCTCKEGFLRAENGTCIPRDQCRVNGCGHNEELNECSNVCDNDSCPTTTSVQNECVGAAVCGPPRCRCLPNFKRNNNGNCIPVAECPKICPEDEEFSDCIQANCVYQNCSQLGTPLACPIIEDGSCEKGCTCKEGFLRAENGTCVPRDQCINNGCSSNEVYSSCIQGNCRIQNCNQRGQSVPCIRIRPEFCIGGCLCAEGYLRNDDGSCIPENKCQTDGCKDNEILNECSNVCDDDTCPTSLQYQECIGTAFCGPPRCSCQINFRRNSNGNCVPISDCAGVCGENEVLNECTDICDDDLCPLSLHKGDCVSITVCGEPNCRCQPTYGRNENGTCIPIGECPGICGENEEYSNCIQSVCRSQHCSAQLQPDSCPAADRSACRQGCVCIEGALRDSQGLCVSKAKCDDGLICGENEVLNECTNRCDDDSCPSYLNEEKKCIAPAVCGPPACRCRLNFRRNDDGVCVPIEECPEICPEYEEYSNCTQSVCRSQLCTEQQKPDPCLAIDSPECRHGCVCIDETLRNAEGICIPENECEATIICGKNEVLNDCTNGCDDDTCPAFLGEIKDCFAPAVCGPPACRCQSNYRRDTSNACIPIAECPGICPENEEYSGCTQAVCRPQRCNEDVKLDCSSESEEYCEEGCVCIDGTMRNVNGTCVPENECESSP